MVQDGISREEIAIFSRTNATSRVLQDRLMRDGIPFRVVGGTKFYERAEIRDAIAYLQLLVNRADQASFARIVNVPRRGIGNTTVSRCLTWANTSGQTVLDSIANPAGVPDLGAAAVKALTNFNELMDSLRQMFLDGARVGGDRDVGGGGDAKACASAALPLDGSAVVGHRHGAGLAQDCHRRCDPQSPRLPGACSCCVAA